LSISNGGQASFTYRHGAIPSSNLIDEDVVFGGLEKLENVIDKTLEYYDSDLLVVINGCTPALIGDDVAQLLKKYQRSPVPVIHADAPGFKGSNIYGHHEVLKAIIQGYPFKKSSKGQGYKEKGLVNILGFVPSYDPHWAGALEEVQRVLEAVGLKPNILYGLGRGIANVKKLPEAEFSLVLDPWVDTEVAELLTERFQTPVFHYPNLPIGPTDTSRFLKELAHYAGLNPKRVNDFIKKSEDEYYFYLSRAVQWLYFGKNSPKKFFVVSTSGYALALTKFLVNDLGLAPAALYATDIPANPDKVADLFAQELRSLEGGVKANIAIQDDPGVVEEEIKSYLAKELKGSGVHFLFGSSWDLDLAEDTRSLLVPISAPAATVVLASHFFGYRGALNLLERIFNQVPNLG
jgi:nitrogenase molybdenum-iron protein beta chain